MAFVDRHDTHAVVGDIYIDGRPDLTGDRRHRFGVSQAKRFPPFVFSIRGGSCLVHRVSGVELHWWKVANRGRGIVRVTRPMAFAKCVCGGGFRLEADISRTCMVPSPDALLCGRCHGEPATFGKDGAGTKARIPRMVAHVKLGCVVAGY